MAEEEEREGSGEAEVLQQVAQKVRQLQSSHDSVEQLAPSEAELELLERVAQWLEAKADAGSNASDVLPRVVDALAAARDAAVAKVAARMSEAESALNEMQKHGYGDLQETYQKVQSLEQTLQALQQQQQQQEQLGSAAPGTSDSAQTSSADGANEEGNTYTALVEKVEKQAQLLDEAIAQKQQLESQLSDASNARAAAEERARNAEAKLSASAEEHEENRLQKALEQNEQLASQLASEQNARAAAEKHAADVEAKLQCKQGDEQQEQMNSGVNRSTDIDSSHAETNETKSLRQQLEEERKAKEDAMSKLEYLGDAFEALEKERNEATNILQEADRTRNELEKERESVSQLKQELLDAQKRQQTEEIATEGEHKQYHTQQVPQQEQEHQKQDASRSSATETLERHLQEQSKALSAMLQSLSQTQELNDNSLLQRIIEPLEIAIKAKDGMQENLNDMEKRALRADHADALESRLQEAHEDIKVIMQGLTSAVGAEDKNLDASALIDHVHNIRVDNERLYQLLQESSAADRDNYRKLQLDEVDEHAAADQPSPAGAEPQQEAEALSEAYNGYVSSLKDRIAELESQLEQERAQKTLQHGNDLSRTNANVESQLSELRRCYEQLKHNFSQHCENQRRLQNFILQQRLGSPSQTPASRNAMDQFTSDDADGLEDDKMYTGSGHSEVDSRSTFDPHFEHGSTEEQAGSEVSYYDDEINKQRPPTRGKRWSPDVATRNQISQQVSEGKRKTGGNKRVSFPSSTRASVGTIDEDEGRAIGNSVHLFVPHTEDLGASSSSPSVAQRKSARAVPVHRREALKEKRHVSKQPAAGRGTPRFCKRPNCYERAGCGSYDDDPTMLAVPKKGKAHNKRKQAKIYTVRRAYG